MKNFRKYILNLLGTVINLFTNLILPLLQLIILIVAVVWPAGSAKLEKVAIFIKSAGFKLQQIELNIKCPGGKCDLKNESKTVEQQKLDAKPEIEEKIPVVEEAEEEVADFA